MDDAFHSMTAMALTGLPSPDKILRMKRYRHRAAKSKMKAAGMFRLCG